MGARPRGPGMQRKDLLQANAAIFSGQGKVRCVVLCWPLTSFSVASLTCICLSPVCVSVCVLQALNQYASRKVKVLVVGNPANTNALIAMENAPDLPRSAFTAVCNRNHKHCCLLSVVRVVDVT